jgi:serine/threonine-protein kinase
LLDLRQDLLGEVVEGSSGTRYRLLELIGEGGQGCVFRAIREAPASGGVVVKVLRPGRTDALKRFEREARVLSALSDDTAPSRHIVRFYDIGVHRSSARAPSLAFIVLELVQGPTLAKVIEAHGGLGLPILRVKQLMAQVAHALSAVHERRIVHRDLKPSNILLAYEDGRELAKVTDFGLVKQSDPTNKLTLSLAGASAGYAPPEQYEHRNERVTAKTDVFSFAAIVYEMLTGAPAFPVRPHESPLHVIARILSGTRPRLSGTTTIAPELRDRVDLVDALDRELTRATSGEPSMRHESIRALWDRVEPILASGARQGTPSLSASAELAQRSSMPSLIAPAPRAAAARLRVLGSAIAGERLRAAVVLADGRSLLAAGERGFYRFADGTWSALQLSLGRAEDAAVRGVVRLSSGKLCFYGEAGVAAVLAPDRAVERIELDRDLSILGAYADIEGLVLVGEHRSSSTGVLVAVASSGGVVPRTLHGVRALHAAIRLGTGAILACGSHGALVEVSEEVFTHVPWGRTGHLLALAPTPGGHAFAVGSGGHALRVTVAPGGASTAALETVQTTRDLRTVAIDASGVAWAAGDHGRLVRRQTSVWERVPLNLAVHGAFILLVPGRQSLVMLTEDGTVLELRDAA